jgi:hypothetical protein
VSDQGRYLCPFCLKPHDVGVTLCPTAQIRVPERYIELASTGTPVASMLTVGYKDHGKTCYLSSLLHALYYGDPIVAWEGFSSIGLDQVTLDGIHDTYVSTLEQGRLPDSTRAMAPQGLVLEWTNVPLAAAKVGPLAVFYAPKTLMLTLYDAPGETFERRDSMDRDLRMLPGLKNLVFLIDLEQMRREANDKGIEPVQNMHRLANTILLATQGSAGKKGIVVVFNKADQYWGNPDYGPLSRRPSLALPGAKGMREYTDYLKNRSKEIEAWVHAEYLPFYNQLAAHFKPVRYASTSALGGRPVGQRSVEVLRPSGIMDPLLHTLMMDGLL